jgi:dTDP-4-dehydrorhamnose 3,5-epimerase
MEDNRLQFGKKRDPQLARSDYAAKGQAQPRRGVWNLRCRHRYSVQLTDPRQLACEHPSEDNGKQMCLPAGFAHDFPVLSDPDEVFYTTTTTRRRTEWCIRRDPRHLGIQAPFRGPPQFSANNARSVLYAKAELLP